MLFYSKLFSWYTRVFLKGIWKRISHALTTSWIRVEYKFKTTFKSKFLNICFKRQKISNWILRCNLNQIRHVPQVIKSSQVKVMTLTLTWLFDFFHSMKFFFFHYFDSKKGPNSLKFWQKCKILIKQPFGT